MLAHFSAVRDRPSILHVDMDAFYAAVEILEDPSLAGKPVIVGGAGSRGVVAACSYEARVFGVHSAMPSVRARRLCPNAVFLAGRFDRYAEYSRRLHEILLSFTPLVEGIALDEAFLDVGGARRLLGEPEGVALELRRRIADELHLTASVGAGTSKLIAKLASEAAKPRVVGGHVEPGPGVFVVAPGQELAFLHALPVQSLWGVGPTTLRRLQRFGVRTVGDLAALPETTVVHALGDAHGRHLHALAWGRDERPVEPDRAAKSIGHEETYAHDRYEPDVLRREAVRMGEAVAARLRELGQAGRTVTVKVRFADFQTITRSRTVAEPVDTGPAVAAVACELLDQVDPTPGVRLLGVSASNLAPKEARQLSLDEAAPLWDEATLAVDEVRQRFGADAVGPASLVGEGGLRMKRRGDQQWGPGGDKRP
ncbi:MAG: DNA polymerase IV [Actinobacteria bacterium]|nr:MAG: DNA polymerase IV [Actinomycetota bacterium]